MRRAVRPRRAVLVALAGALLMLCALGCTERTPGTPGPVGSPLPTSTLAPVQVDAGAGQGPLTLQLHVGQRVTVSMADRKLTMTSPDDAVLLKTGSDTSSASFTAMGPGHVRLGGAAYPIDLCDGCAGAIPVRLIEVTVAP